MQHERNKLIILEGASGSGKTSIQLALHRSLSDKGYKVKSINEFSDSPLGVLLKNAHGLHKHGYPHYLKNLAGALTYLSDKVYGLQTCISESFDFIILDRYFISQIILGSALISDHHYINQLQNIVLETHLTFKNSFSNQSRVFTLECEFPEIIQRIEKRESIILSSENINFIAKTAAHYKVYDYTLYGWQHKFISTDLGMSDSIDKIMNVLITED